MKSFTAATKAAGGQQAVLGTQFLSLYKAQGGFNDMLKSGAPAAQTFTGAMKGMLGDQTGLQVALHLTGENMVGFKGRIAAVSKASTDSKGNVKDWSITQNLLSVQLGRTKQMVEVLAVDIGSKLIPIVSSVVGWFLKHKGVTEALAAVIGGAMVVAIGAYVTKLTWGALETVGKLGVMVASWLGLGPAVTEAAAATTVATGEIAVASEAAGTATTMAFGPIGLAIAAVGVAAMLLASHWKQIWHGIKAVAMDVWNNGLKQVFDFIRDHWKILVEILTGGLGVIAVHWREVWHGIKAVYDAVIAPVFDFIKEHWGLLLAILTGGFSLLIQHWSDIWQGLQALWTMFGKPVFDAIASAWKVVWTSVKKVYDTLIAPVFRFIREHWKLLAAVLTGGMSLLIQHWRTVWGAVKTVYNSTIAPVFHAIGTAGRKVGDGLKWAWDHVVQPIFHVIKSGVHLVSTVVGKTVKIISDLWKKIGEGLKWAWDHTIGPILDKIKSGIQDVKDLLDGSDFVGFGTGGVFHKGGTGKLVGSATIPGHAAGGSVGDGWFTVGERGPEIGHKQGNQVRIFSNSESNRMGGGGGDGVVEVHVYNVIDGKVISKKVERKQLQTGMRRGTTYQPFARARS
jgi:hypothetical protein